MTLYSSRHHKVGPKPEERKLLVRRLSRFRQDWQKTADGKSLLNVEVSIGLLLSDIASQLEMTKEERQIFLGTKLTSEVSLFIGQKIKKRKPL